jgi:hypothetical protein
MRAISNPKAISDGTMAVISCMTTFDACAFGEAPNSGPPQPQHFWQKPGCGSAIGQTALGLAGSAVEVGAVIFVGPELLAAAGAEAGGAALLEGGELVESGMSVAHVVTGLGTLLAAPAVLTANGTMGIFKNCF